MPAAGMSPTTRSVGSVRVPVLSVHTTSTEASDSIALSCCARTPRWAILNAETAAVTAISRISPSGTRLTMPAVSACTRAEVVSGWANTDAVRPITNGTESATSHSRSRSLALSSGERGCRKARAVAVSCSARLSAPTAVASNSPPPSATNEPDQTRSPGPRTTSSDSPVRLDSSSASASAAVRVPSATTWSPAERRTRSPATTWSTGTRRSTPPLTTTASGATSAARRSRARFDRISWKDPIAMFETRIPRNRASRHDANTIVTTPKTSRIALGIVRVLARTMLE